MRPTRPPSRAGDRWKSEPISTAVAPVRKGGSAAAVTTPQAMSTGATRDPDEVAVAIWIVHPISSRMKYLKRPAATPESVTQEIRQTVSRIISEVEKEGTAAVRRWSERLDGWSPPTFRVGDEEIRRAYHQMEPRVAEAGSS
ncbi:MAG: hypothetical protein KatS3mg011_2008 [Acidimicrobiia bacterium]|nr:MAG: hypothetical protein KatS3mg011_2008 [Acidimicrobiia bacterium]